MDNVGESDEFMDVLQITHRNEKKNKFLTTDLLNLLHLYP